MPLVKARTATPGNTSWSNNRWLAAWLLSLLVVAAAVHPAAAQQPTPTPKPAMWKLEDEDSEIWLFGTVHILNPALRWRTPQIDSAFEEAEVFYSEAPVVEADPQTMQPLIMAHGINHSGVPFTEKLSAQGKKDLKQVIASLGMSDAAISQFEPFRPWLAAVTIGALHVQKNGGDPDAGVDKTLWHEAVEDGKTLGYFETMEQQISLFGAMTSDEELRFFEDGLRQLIEDPDLLDDITADWQAGRVETLGDKLNSTLEGQDSLKERMMVNRNRAWAEIIRDLMAADGKIFIAAGAGHFAGTGSVQEHLEQMGFTVTRIQ